MDQTFEPCVQIVHISDPHFVAASSDGHARTRAKLSTWKWYPMFRALKPLIEEGTAPHSESAPVHFEEFLKSITIQDDTWGKDRTWLVCTGDITTYGDRTSLDEAIAWLEKCASYTRDKLWLHGNHDEWPHTIPCLVPKDQTNQHHEALNTYRSTWPKGPLKMEFRDRERVLVGEVQLYGLNTVIHSRWWNTLAQGEVDRAALEALKEQIDSGH